MTSTSAPAAQRNLQLDLLRLAAVALVFFRHTVQWYGSSPPQFFQALVRAGWMGVDLFFALSGFLIGGLLFLEQKRWGRISLRRFYARRVLKLYPSLYVCVAVAILLHLIRGDVTHIALLKRAVGEFLFLQNYLSSILGFTWSLAVEEHFYIAMPLLLVCLSRPSHAVTDRRSHYHFANILWVYPLCALGTLLLRAGVISAGHFEQSYLFKTHLRFDSLLVGVALAYLYQFHADAFGRWTHRYRWPLVIAGTAAFSPAFFFEIQTSPTLFVFGLPLVSVGAAALIAGFLAFQILDARPIRLLGFLGASSYSIYLFHRMLFELGEYVATRLFARPPMVVVVSFQYAFALSIGVLAGKLIEFPVLKFRDRVFPSRTGEPVKSDGRQGTIDQAPISPSEALEPI